MIDLPKAKPVHHLCSRFVLRLVELFLCLNDYHVVSQSCTSCPSLRLLQITDNHLRDWAEVRKFGQMYPSLSELVLANNSVECVGDTREALQRLFPNLRCINLNNSGQGRCAIFIPQYCDCDLYMRFFFFMVLFLYNKQKQCTKMIIVNKIPKIEKKTFS